MKARALLLASLLAALALQTGCWVFSVYPLAGPEDETIFDKQLVGTWMQPKGCSISFLRFSDEKLYRVTYNASPSSGDNCLLSSGQSASFQGTLVDIGGMRFLDVFPADHDETNHMVLTHSFYRVHVDATALQLTPLNFEWANSQVQQNRAGLVGVVRPDGKLVLTSSTKQLRDFLRSYGNSDEAFPIAGRLDFDRRMDLP